MGSFSGQRIFIAGHRGMVGSAIVRSLKKSHAVTNDFEILTRTREELDLNERDAVRVYFQSSRPTQVILTAAKVGGIKANNDYPVQFLLQNLRVQENVIEAAH